MRWMIIIGPLLLGAGCAGSSTSPSPTASPAPPPIVAAPPAPILPVRGPQFDQAFWNCFVHDACDSPSHLHALARLTAAPMLYIRTVDDAGRPIDSVTLDTVQNAMLAVAATWGGGQFGVRGVERGTETRARISGWLTVRWLGTNAGTFCGQSDVGADGGVIDFNYLSAGGVCGCAASKIRPRTARHELGHAFGYEHTGNAADLMSGLSVTQCDQEPSARETYHATIAYQSPVGTADRVPTPPLILD